MDEKLKYILIFAFVLNSVFVLSNFQERTYDSYEHIFFADHYRRLWFDSWEQKWYGGFTVTSYPPLAHQTLAFLSYAIGLELSNKVLNLALMTIFPLIIYKFSRIFVTENGSIFAAVLAVLLPSMLQTAYSWGQFPTIFGLVAGLSTIVYFDKFLGDGIWLNFFIALGLLGVTVSAHHFTAVFLVPILILILVSNNFIRRRNASKVLIKRVLLFTLLGILLCLIVIYPYWQFAVFDSVRFTAIPHLTRVNLFFDSFAFELFFWNMYGPLVFLIPLFIMITFKKRILLPLMAGATVLFALGLGGSSPLPQLMFGHFWETLTYDRFSLWAGILFLPFAGQLFAERNRNFTRKRLYKALMVAFFVTLIFTGFWAATKSLIFPSGASMASVNPAIEFLNDSEVQHWRYLTLGFGEPAMLKLSVYGGAKNIDGYYFFVRRDPLLAQSGIGMLDTARYFGEKGLKILGEVLSNASKYSLRWVICSDPSYFPILRNNSFVERWSQDNTGDGRFGGMTIWESSDLPPEYVPNNPVDRGSRVFDYMWGIGPPFVLLFTIVLLIIKLIKRPDDCL